MKSKKKYSRNKKASPYTLSKYMAGGASIFDSFPDGGLGDPPPTYQDSMTLYNQYQENSDYMSNMFGGEGEYKPGKVTRNDFKNGYFYKENHSNSMVQSFDDPVKLTMPNPDINLLDNYQKETDIAPTGTETYSNNRVYQRPVISGQNSSMSYTPDSNDGRQGYPFTYESPGVDRININRFQRPVGSSNVLPSASASQSNVNTNTPPKPNMNTDWTAVLQSEGKDGSYSSRKQMYNDMGLAAEFGAYNGSSAQNISALKRYKTPKTNTKESTVITPTATTQNVKKDPVNTSSTSVSKNKKIIQKINLHGKTFDVYDQDELDRITKMYPELKNQSGSTIGASRHKETTKGWDNDQLLDADGNVIVDLNKNTKEMKKTTPNKEYSKYTNIKGKQYGFNTIEEFNAIAKNQNMPKGWAEANAPQFAKGGAMPPNVPGKLDFLENPNGINDIPGGNPTMPYGQMGQIAAQGIELGATNEQFYGQEIDSQGEAVGKGALKGAGQGATLGTMIMPGVGTAIGAGVGAIAGGLSGNEKNQNQREQIQKPLQSMSGNVSQNPYGIPSMEEGGMMNNPLINIQSDELMVDLDSGNVIEDYKSPRYKSHSKGKNKEHLGNFVEAQENGVVIPRKWRESYLDNKTSRKGIIRDVLNKQVDRELYGKDVDGNAKSFAKMKDGGVQQYLYGGVKKYNYGGGNDPLKQHENDLASFNPSGGFPPEGDYPEIDLSRIPDKTGETFNVNQIDPRPKNTNKDSVWTRGNTIGAAGNIVGGLGPLAMTLANGMDKDEVNEYANVEGAAINELSGIHRRGKEDTLNNIKRQANVVSNINRNRSGSFASMLSNEQNIINNTQQSLAEAGLGYDTNEASATSQLRMQGDLQDARGRTQKNVNEDMNKDNYYSNLSDNVSNLGDMTQGFGKNMNQNESNKVKLKMLQEISSDFTMDSKGNFLFKGKIVNV